MTDSDKDTLLKLAGAELSHTFASLPIGIDGLVSCLEKFALEHDQKNDYEARFYKELASRRCHQMHDLANGIGNIVNWSLDGASSLNDKINEYLDNQDFYDSTNDRDVVERYSRGEKLIPHSPDIVLYHRNLDNSLTEANINEDLFSLLLHNLLKNSKANYASNVVVSTYEEEGYAVTSVWDDGHGIPEEELPYVTEPFRTSGKGHGIGLSVVDLSLKNLDGKLEIDSEYGEFCDMKMYIPIQY